jgi:hypothetical protein
MSTLFTRMLAENVIVSYLYAGVLFLIANWTGDIEVSLGKGALLAGIPAALAVIKGALASRVGSTDSPQFTE